MMWPLLTEQFLQLIVGLADTMIVSHAGEDAVSGIALAATLYAVFMFAFNALGIGGSVIISQYLGSGQDNKADEAGTQLYRLSDLFSLACMALTLVFGRAILHGLYWKVTPEVMKAAETYLFILSFSLPMNALYNAGAAIFKSNGLTRTTMLWNLILTLGLPLYMRFYSTTPAVLALVVSTTVLHNIFTAFVSPLAQSLPCGFKAAGDVKYPMVTSLICTCGVRVAFTFLLGVWLRMGLMGYMWAMCIDWSVKAVLMVIHAARGSWKNKRIIEA